MVKIGKALMVNEMATKEWLVNSHMDYPAANKYPTASIINRAYLPIPPVTVFN